MVRITSFIILILAGCGNERAARKVFNKAPGEYSGYAINQEYEIVQNIDIMEYDYLQIPLVNPGIQLILPQREADLEDGEDGDSSFRITGHLSPGDRIKIVDFKIDGGWIPHGGNWLLPNPIVMILSGPERGRTIGISLISLADSGKNKNIELDDLPWTVKYIQPDPGIIRILGK